LLQIGSNLFYKKTYIWRSSHLKGEGKKINLAHLILRERVKKKLAHLILTERVKKNKKLPLQLGVTTFHLP